MHHSDTINMRLHELSPRTYDWRADFLASVALDDSTPAKVARRLMRDARAIFKRTVARVRRVVGRPPKDASITVQLDAQPAAMEQLVDDLATLAVSLGRDGKLDWSAS